MNRSFELAIYYSPFTIYSKKMRILFIGDVFARPGRTAVLERIQDLREQYQIDLAVMNCENVANGSSVTESIGEQLLQSGIDAMTGGNHSFDKQESAVYYEKQPRVLRPANYPIGTPGSGLYLGETKNGVGYALMNFIGRVFMAPNSEDPFRAADTLVNELPADIKVRLVDIHCEATSEKCAMGWFLDGRVSAVVGTHSHVQTADERILTAGTAYITDIGLTGSHNGVIGMNKDDVIWRFTRVPGKRAGHAEGDVWICAVVIDVDEETGKARSIERLKLAHQS
ncbi:MAG: TIGR00282 family metallophosphoesterase [Pyrinomonadaceae bacterium]